MREHPILFSGPMVRAILAGTKTQTRRVAKLPMALAEGHEGVRVWKDTQGRFSLSRKAAHTPGVREPFFLPCPYGQPGGRLWVRETWRPWNDVSELWDCVQYRSDGAMMKPRDLDRNQGGQFSEECDATITDQIDGRDTPWRPSIFMPRWASRITLEVTDVRVQRVQEISEEDANAEGAPERSIDTHFAMYRTARADFKSLWDSINASRGFGWDVNPWVWAITFRRVG